MGIGIVGAVAIGAVGLLAGGIGGAGAASADPGSPRAAIVSIGDSFISGEGGGGYGDSGGGGCHRSPMAPIRSAPVAAVAINLACTGARTRNLWPSSRGGEWSRGEPPQADRLAAAARAHAVRLIVVTAGANDVGFGDIVARCALDWARSDPADPRLCRGRAQADVAAALPAMRRGLAKALRGIRATMAAASYGAVEYRLVVMGYASPFPPGRWIRYPEDGWSRLRRGGCPLWNADAEWAALRATPEIDAAMRAVAHDADAEYLDLQQALDGHQLCDRRADPGTAGPARAEWVRPLGFGPTRLRESLHPNALGQPALGVCIALHYASPAGDYACRGAAGRGYEAIVLEPLG
jgi:lysophospholipase L1-like esterase